MANSRPSSSLPIKVFVDVRVDFRKDGVMLPREITWEDGTKYEIDKVVDIRQAAAKRAGGQGDRYTVMISGNFSYEVTEQTTYLIVGENPGFRKLAAATANHTRIIVESQLAKMLGDSELSGEA